MNELPKSVLKKAVLFYAVLLYASIFFTVLSALGHFLSGPLLVFSPEMDYYWLTSCILISIILIPSGFYLFSRKAQVAKETQELDKKISFFQLAIKLKLSLFAIAAFVNILYYALSANQQGLLFILMVIIVLLISKPTQTQFENEFI